MAKAQKKTAKPKKRASKYEQKLRITGTFDELAKALISPKNSIKKK